MKNFFVTIILFQFLNLTFIYAQVSFISNGQRLNGLAGRGVVLSDLNKDGNLDAFIVNDNGPEGNGYRVYFGSGKGEFKDSISLTNPIPWSGQPVTGDFTGSGKLEIITGWTIWTCDGKNNFTPDTTRFNMPHDVMLNSIAAADLNGDNFPDLFVTTYSRNVNDLRVYFNDGKGHFIDGGQRLLQGKGIHYPAVLGDLNGDGYIDAVTTGWRGKQDDPCPNRILLNDGKGNFKETGQVLEEGGSHCHGLALADIDKDGDLDAVIGMQNEPHARIYLNDGHAQFTKGQSLGIGKVEKILAADFNSDGFTDLFLACNDPNEVWINDSKGNFTDSKLRLGSEWSWNAAIGDLNNDGKPDISVVNFYTEFKNNKYTVHGRNAEVWLNK
jgi:hypothetical protein